MHDLSTASSLTLYRQRRYAILRHLVHQLHTEMVVSLLSRIESSTTLHSSEHNKTALSSDRVTTNKTAQYQNIMTLRPASAF